MIDASKLTINQMTMTMNDMFFSTNTVHKTFANLLYDLQDPRT